MTPTQPTPFLPFLETCRTFDPAADEPRPVPVDWTYIRDLAREMERSSRLVIVKSRQMMVTWIGCAWILHRALSSGPGVHLVLSKEERSAKELIERIRFLLDHLPPGTAVDEKTVVQKGQILFPERDSRILSLPASPHAVRGLSPRTVFWDEMAFTEYDEEIWTAVKPAVDAGGSFLGVSTPNGPTGVFARLVHEPGETFHVHRLHFSANPERTKSWENSARDGLSEARWRREQELSFEGAEGRVYDQFEYRLHVAPHGAGHGRRTGVRLYRGIDFGYRRPAVIWAREAQDGSLFVFDCLLGDRWPVDELLSRIRAVDRLHHLGERDFTWTAVDPAGAANNDFGISPVEALQRQGMNIVSRTSSVSPGIEAVRAMLLDANGRIGLKVHPRCAPLITAFQAYAWAENGEEPLKDGEHDHLMDALRYLVINLPRFQRSPCPQPARVAGLAPFPRR